MPTCPKRSGKSTLPLSKKTHNASKVRAFLAAMEHAGKCSTPHCKERGGLCREVRLGLIHISRCKFKNRFCAQTASKSPTFIRSLIQSRCCSKCSQVGCLLQLHNKQCVNKATCFVCNACPHFIDRSGACCPSSINDVKKIMMPPPKGKRLGSPSTPPPVFVSLSTLAPQKPVTMVAVAVRASAIEKANDGILNFGTCVAKPVAEGLGKGDDGASVAPQAVSCSSTVIVADVRRML